jgi:hypothetical protein
MPNDGSHEKTDDPLHADRRNFYKVEEWSRGRAANWGCCRSGQRPEVTPSFRGIVTTSGPQ